MLEDYLGEEVVKKMKDEERIPKAEPKLYDYRERFKKRALLPSDLKVLPNYKNVSQQNAGEFDSINRQAGDQVFFGPGTEIDF